MLFSSIRWRIAFPYVILILGLMVALTIYLSTLFQNDYANDIGTQLETQTRFAGQVLEEYLALDEPTNGIDADLALRWSSKLGMRVTIIDVNGQVLSESGGSRERMDNHLSRPEVQQALASGWGTASRLSSTLGYEMLYGAVSFRDTPDNGQIVGVIRLAVPISEIDAGAIQARQAILMFTLVATGLALLLASLIAERTARPIRQLTDVAERMARGDLGARLLPFTRDEVGKLTVMFNWMAEQLQEQVTTLSSQRRRLAAILEHMADGMIITDDNDKVQTINRAAARMLGTTQKAAVGRSFAQVARDHQLIQTWQQCTQWDEEQTATFEIDRHSMFVRIIATPIHEQDTQTCLVMIQDLTQVRRLESVRRDFISNISHELRTPLVSLKALVDALQDGAMDDPPAAETLLDRIQTELDGLTQMIEELLELSLIESGRAPLKMVPTDVAAIVYPAIEQLQPQLERARLSLTVDIEDGTPPVLADEVRVQRVVTNLVHNAIKFTPSGGTITVRSRQNLKENEVVISVSDSGIGISPDDLPRVFERLYKADRSRSDQGTGLGLAIARHIIQNHDGRIWVESVEGKGSTFHFSLPIAE